jgi:hypothetical protein
MKIVTYVFVDVYDEQSLQFLALLAPLIPPHIQALIVQDNKGLCKEQQALVFNTEFDVYTEEPHIVYHRTRP